LFGQKARLIDLVRHDREGVFLNDASRGFRASMKLPIGLLDQIFGFNLIDRSRISRWSGYRQSRNDRPRAHRAWPVAPR